MAVKIDTEHEGVLKGEGRTRSGRLRTTQSDTPAIADQAERREAIFSLILAWLC